MKLRRGIPDDAEGITRVHVESWRSAYRGLVPDRLLDQVDMSARTERWRGILGQDNGSVLVVEDDVQIRGFCHIRRPEDTDVDAETTGEIVALYVDPGVWRKGYGRVLCDGALEELSKRGFSEAILWVFEENAPARRFYEAAGFVFDSMNRKHPRLGLNMVRYRRELD